MVAVSWVAVGSVYLLSGSDWPANPSIKKTNGGGRGGLCAHFLVAFCPIRHPVFLVRSFCRASDFCFIFACLKFR